MTNNLDSMGVEKALELFPDQCLQAWSESSVATYDGKNINNVVVCGMGGSRFTPLTIKYLYEDRIKVPYLINDTYSLPGFVNETTLIILSSYSGTTEEVLVCAKEAEAKNCKIAVITSAGDLKKISKQKGYPGYVFDPKNNPSGQPRLGAGYMLMGHLGLLKAFGLISVQDKEVLSSIGYARSLTAKFSEEYQNLAEILQNKYPVIVISEHLRGFANGFANQINENAKAFSDFRIISELNHHLMEGLTNPSNLKSHLLFLFMNSSLYHPRIQKRFDLTEEVVSKQGIKTHSIELNGPDRLSQVFEAFILSGFTTYKLSKLYGVDPIKIPWVDYFKEKLG